MKKTINVKSKKRLVENSLKVGDKDYSVKLRRRVTDLRRALELAKKALQKAEANGQPDVAEKLRVRIQELEELLANYNIDSIDPNNFEGKGGNSNSNQDGKQNGKSDSDLELEDEGEIPPEEPDDPNEPDEEPQEPGNNDDKGKKPGKEPNKPGQEPGDDPVNEPGDDPVNEPGEESGDDPQEPGGGSREPGDEPREPGEEPGEEPQEPGQDPTDKGKEPGDPKDGPNEPGEEPGDDPGREPGDDPVENPSKNKNGKSSNGKKSDPDDDQESDDDQEGGEGDDNNSSNQDKSKDGKNSKSNNKQDPDDNDDNSEGGGDEGDESEDSEDQNGKGQSKNQSSQKQPNNSQQNSDEKNKSKSQSKPTLNQEEDDEDGGGESEFQNPFADDDDISSNGGLPMGGKAPRQATKDETIELLGTLTGEGKEGAKDALKELIAKRKAAAPVESFKSLGGKPLTEAVKSVRDMTDDEFGDYINDTYDLIDQADKVTYVDDIEARKKKVGNWSQDPTVIQDLMGEDNLELQKDYQKKKARDAAKAKYSHQGGLEDFKMDFYAAIHNQIEMVKQEILSYDEINNEYESEDIIMKAEIEREIPAEAKPIIDVYFDVSGSWEESDIKTGEAAIASVKVFEDQGDIVLNVFFFSDGVDNVSMEHCRDTYGTGTHAWPEILQNIKATGAKNVLIMTDGDFERLSSYGYPTSPAKNGSLTVEGCVWYLWKNGEASPSCLPKLKGRQGTYQYSFRG